MNKCWTCLPVAMLLGGIILMRGKDAAHSNLANKNISLVVYKSHSYKSPVYKNTSAEVRIVVEKINAQGQHSIVWEKSMNAKSLSKYPTAENALQQNVIVHNLNDKKEYLVVDYTLIYNSKGSELQMHDETIVENKKSSKINISI